MDIQNDPRTYAIIGAAMEVHKHLGCGFLEAVYQEAMELEMIERSIPFESQVQLPIHYKGRLLQTFYRADVIGYGSVIVELKALGQIGGIEEAQIINYLKDRLRDRTHPELRPNVPRIQAVRAQQRSCLSSFLS